jgi:hypothetical protein
MTFTVKSLSSLTEYQKITIFVFSNFPGITIVKIRELKPTVRNALNKYFFTVILIYELQRLQQYYLRRGKRLNFIKINKYRILG